MNVSEIPLSAWVVGGLIAFFFLLTILSIPSFIAMYKLGFKNYVRNIKLLYTLYKKLNICYWVEQEKTYRLQDQYGNITTTKRKESDYYFPVYVDDSKLFIVHRTGEGGYFWNMTIQDSDYDGNTWNTKTIEIRTIACMFTQTLNDRFQKRLNKLAKKNIKLERIDNLNELLNSEITSIRREGKLNQILMNE
jgi:hypothetical protein